MTTTDYVMLGRLSPQALAAGALGFNLYQPAFLLGIGVVAAVSPIAAAKIGAGDCGRRRPALDPSGAPLRPRHRGRGLGLPVADGARS